MTYNPAIVFLTVYFVLACHPNEVLIQGFSSCDDRFPDENNGHGMDMQKSEPDNSFLLYPPECGLNSGEFNRVVGGQPAAPGAWPWMAAIVFNIRGFVSVGDIFFKCGGTIISERHILTAAHCMRYVDVDYAVHLGITNIHDEGVRIMVENVTIHPNFSLSPIENDIAILKLKQKISFTDKIRPICLPLSSEIRNKNLTRNHPFVAGWGVTVENGKVSEVLMEAQIPVVSNSVCEDNYNSKAETASLFRLDDRVLCAGYREGGIDSCKGDSGGPLMFPLKNIYYLIGVISGGWHCADPNYPGVYTRVTSFLDFIISNLN